MGPLVLKEGTIKIHPSRVGDYSSYDADTIVTSHLSRMATMYRAVIQTMDQREGETGEMRGRGR